MIRVYLIAKAFAVDRVIITSERMRNLTLELSSFEVNDLNKQMNIICTLTAFLIGSGANENSIEVRCTNSKINWRRLLSVVCIGRDTKNQNPFIFMMTTAEEEANQIDYNENNPVEEDEASIMTNK